MNTTWLKGLALSLVIVALLAIPVTASADGIQLVMNPDFAGVHAGNQSQPFASWSIGGNGNTKGVASFPTSGGSNGTAYSFTSLPPNSGPTGLIIGGNGSAYQDITLPATAVAGETFEVQFYVENNQSLTGSGESINLQVTSDNSDDTLLDLTYTPLAASGWVLETADFQPEVGDTTESLELTGVGSGSSRIALTDVTVTPEPSSLLLLGTGLLGLAFVAFRKAKTTGVALKSLNS